VVHLSYKKSTSGFTIVELLIVIVVIAILAAISIVAYNGIQKRATITRTTSDLNMINKAILTYHAEHGSYPIQSTWNAKIEDFIPEIVPNYASKLPQNPVAGSSARYMYRSNGTNYKLISHTDNLCAEATSNQPNLIDPTRNCWAYGYWSPGAASW